ncbi:MAG: hypothetical protein EOP83_06590 [Verrucomicrobiaceae bacterium]|nr:MAG: hypothetical protein EOP83_06590 [Verrucomicrobiaceae bacterium]
MGWATSYIEKLRQGETVVFRPRGNSMIPLIKSGQQCTVIPYTGQELKRRDIVLCKVNGAQYLHLVTATRPNEVQISNNKGKINGWASLNQIFGILSKVEP